MEMTRRSALGVIGGILAAPTLFLKETPKLSLGQTSSLKIIPTGLPKLDGLIDGGLRKGELCLICGGTATGKSIMARTIALNASDKATVALAPGEMTWYKPYTQQENLTNFKGRLTIIPELDFGSIENFISTHDLLVIDQELLVNFDSPLYLMKNKMEQMRILSHLARKYNTAIVITRHSIRQSNFSLPVPASYLYYPSIVLQLHKLHWAKNLRTNAIKIGKNCYGHMPDHSQLLIIDKPRMIFNEFDYVFI